MSVKEIAVVVGDEKWLRSVIVIITVSINVSLQHQMPFTNYYY